MINDNDKYICVKQIMSLICSCKDAQKGTLLTARDWLNSNYSISNGIKLTINDLLNEKYFTKQNGYISN